MKKISVIVPVYRHPKLAGAIIESVLASPYPNREMIVIVDGGTNHEIEAVLEPHREKISVHYNAKNIGKAASLNYIGLKLDTDILLFLDNDIELPGDPEFLAILSREFDEHDIVELPKDAIVNSFVSAMMEYEFFSYAIASYSFAKISRRCPSMNGAAFAIRSDLFKKLNGFARVQNEDMDLAARAFYEHARFSYPIDLKVKNEVPTTVYEWFRQRKRWATNNVLWFLDNIGPLGKNFMKDRGLRFSILLVFLPFIVLLGIFFLLRLFKIDSVIPAVMMIAMHANILTGILLAVSQYELLVNSLISFSIGLGVSGLFYAFFAWALKFRIRLIPFLFFYLFYSPVWFIANIIFGIAVLLKININIEWMITEEDEN